MFDRSDLRAAVGANIMSAEQAARLEAFLLVRGGHQGAQEDGQENLRFLSNFNDIFITLGLIILFTGVTALAGMMAGPSALSGNLLAGVLIAAPVAGLAWLLLEYFGARRRLLLPSMALSIIFVMFCSIGAVSVAAAMVSTDFEASVSSLFDTTGFLGVTAFASAAVAAGLVFLRFRLPFSLALVALAVAGTMYVSFGFGGNLYYVIGGGLSFLLGVATMLAAIWFDMKDPERIRKASDNAFWLHLAAAPQIIAGVSTMVTGSNILAGSTTGTDNSAQALVLLIVLLALGIVSLALNRRALIAASILTFMFTLSFMLSRAGFEVSSIFMIVAIIIGGGVVLLGAGWKTARRLVLATIPKAGIWGRLFPPEPV